MSRIRTIKPEFWTSEQVMECSPLARLVFIGMWNFCDDQGVHPASVKTLKAELFPADDMTAADVGNLVAELIANRLLTEFEAGGKRFWFVTGWRHQLIKNPSAPKYPKPPTPVLPQSYPSPTGGRDPVEEGKGRERKGIKEEEEETIASERETHPSPKTEKPSSSSSPEVLIGVWNEINPDKAVRSLPPRRRSAIQDVVSYVAGNIGKQDWPAGPGDIAPWFADLFRYARSHDGYLRDRDLGFFLDADRLSGVVEGGYEPRH